MAASEVTVRYEGGSPLKVDAGGVAWAGPMKEGVTVSLSCQATGGRPAPQISWWKGDERIEARHTRTRRSDSDFLSGSRSDYSIDMGEGNNTSEDAGFGEIPAYTVLNEIPNINMKENSSDEESPRVARNIDTSDRWWDDHPFNYSSFFGSDVR